ncbi:MAG: threonine--tRNA ligase [Actinomycetota bacterium]|nr:threonine--tRNA ligase [Actinomycetota bacterium]
MSPSMPDTAEAPDTARPDAVCYELPDGTLADLSASVPSDARVLTQGDEQGRQVLRHSTAHVLAQAVLSLWPHAKYAGGPPIEDGFYYDFDIGRPFTPQDLERIEQKMAEIVREDQPFVRQEVSVADAAKVFEDQPYKLEWINEMGDESEEQGVSGDKVSLYRNADKFVDLCRGPHIPSTGRIRAFKLTKSSGAYWRGDERRPMLQRIYGTAWESKDALEDYLWRLEEAEKRDHRRLGPELDLFHFPPELGQGLVVFHPKGGLVRKLIEDYARAEHEAAGYEFVWTPHLSKSTLFEISGHLDWYREGMYPPMELEGSTYYPKPMNCPLHLLIYKSRTRSYRELPLRLFEFGTVYRFERSGVLHGLTRLRGFTQDDSHIFCTPDQLARELAAPLEFVLKVLKEFGLTEFEAELSTRPEKFVGEPEEWDQATNALRDALESAGLSYRIGEGEGTFYAPKIDVHVRDAIGRRWQISTLQVDFQFPQRFDLEYVGEDGGRHRPFMIHRALFGSVERFFGILLEHYGGAFPTWLAPEQVVIIPIAERHHQYAAEVAEQLSSLGVRAAVDSSNQTLGNRIRRAQTSKVPYSIVVGDKEAQARLLSVRPRRGSEQRGVTLEKFAEAISHEISSRGSPESSA